MEYPKRIIYEGEKYYIQTTGRYYSRRHGEERLLHRVIWQRHNGSIPTGMSVHHKNHDWNDNRIDNLKRAIIRAFICLKDIKIQSLLNEIKSIFSRQSPRLQCGIDHPKAWLGTNKMERTVWLNESAINALAPYVEEYLNQYGNEQRSVQRNVKTNRLAFVALLKESARFVVQALKSLSTLQRTLVPVSVPRLIAGKPAEVYNLTLEEHNAYYANGILVENCGDSLVLLIHVARSHALGFVPGTFKDKITVKPGKFFQAKASVWEMNYGVEDRD